MFEIILVTKVVLLTVTHTELPMFEVSMSIININILKTCISVILAIILSWVIAVTILLFLTRQQVGAGGLVPCALLHRDVRVLPPIADDTTPVSHRVVGGYVPPLSPIIAEWCFTDASCHILEAMFMVAVLPSVTAVTCVLFIFIFEVPTLTRLKPVMTHELEAVILICLADLNLPGFIASTRVFLSEPAPHRGGLGGWLRAGGEGGGGVVVVAEAGVAGAHVAVQTVWRVRLKTMRWTMGMIIIIIRTVQTFDTNISLVEQSALLPLIMTVKPCQVSPVPATISCQAHCLVLVTDFLGEVLFVFPLPPDHPVPAV